MENKVEIITEGFPEHGKEQILLDEITCKYYQDQIVQKIETVMVKK